MLFIYSLFWELFLLILKVLLPINSKIRFQLGSREMEKYFMPDRDNIKETVIIFCSSAGELEQALPIIKELEKQMDPVILFFSASGFHYAKSIGLEDPYFMIRSDAQWDWAKIFKHIRPKMVILIRHGFWPGMIFSTRTRSKLIGVNISERPDATFFSRLTKRFFLGFFDEIHLTENISGWGSKGSIGPTIQISGDTKYDRVLQRKLDQNGSTLDLEDQFSWMVLGSAYLQELKFVTKAYYLIENRLSKKWKVAVLPHDLGKENISSIRDSLEGAGFPHILEERLGLLFWYYSQAEAAIIGGGFNKEGVHNILEAAVFDVPIFSGPSINAEKEAVEFKARGILKVFESVEELADHWLELDQNKIHGKGSELVRSKAGATKSILSKMNIE